MNDAKDALSLADTFQIEAVEGRLEFGFWSTVGEWIGDHCAPGGPEGTIGAHCSVS